MVVIAAVLAFISVWFSLILNVKGGIEGSRELLELEAAASDLREAADAVCLMGPGSSREVEVKIGAGKLELEKKGLELSVGSRTVQKTLRCECMTRAIKIGESPILFENKGGKIVVGDGA
ncbi:MAG: hypothetical protein ABIF01_00715 [Candidatus Micrarchaeota archaeon]